MTNKEDFTPPTVAQPAKYKAGSLVSCFMGSFWFEGHVQSYRFYAEIGWVYAIKCNTDNKTRIRSESELMQLLEG